MNPLSYPYCTGRMSPFGRNLTATIAQTARITGVKTCSSKTRKQQVKCTILNYQSPTTGLFSVKTCSTCKEAKVRDSLYCAASIWALALAYRRIDDDMGRTHELEHSAIKCMRGIMYCYMQQSDKVGHSVTP
ncbi:hypothetical protein cypCar_00013399 [Cyprinus carpio]|nr:hypothetical protein cypCar_00013399 [Cyprinus carpio]